MTLSGVGDRLRPWLRRGIAAVAALAAVVSVYALAAIAWRTLQEGWTPNRAAFVGWNVINTLLLVWLVIRQWRRDGDSWLPAVQDAFGLGALLYAGWSLFVIFGLPLVF
jgi:hypothetical protein